MYKNIGIYCITNNINGKKYVGQSTDLKERRRGHKYSHLGEKPKYLLQRAFIKYGIDNFTFTVLEECEKELLDDRERYWIKKLGTYGGGYNLTVGGTTGSTKITDEMYKGIENDLRSTDLTWEEIGDKYGLSVRTIQHINTGYRNKREDVDYPIRVFRNNKANKVKKYCKDCNVILKGENSKRCLVCSLKYRRRNFPEKDYLLKNVAEKGFKGVGKDYGVTGNTVKRWCKVRGLPSKIRDIEYLSEHGKLREEKENEKGSGYHWKNIKVTTPEGDIKEFENVTGVIEYIGVTREEDKVRWRKGITRVLRGENKRYKGYKFTGRK